MEEERKKQSKQWRKEVEVMKQGREGERNSDEETDKASKEERSE